MSLRLLVTVALFTGCAARSTSTPTTRAYAAIRFVQGATPIQIGEELGISRWDARATLRDAIVDLNRRYYRAR